MGNLVDVAQRTKKAQCSYRFPNGRQCKRRLRVPVSTSNASVRCQDHPISLDSQQTNRHQQHAAPAAAAVASAVSTVDTSQVLARVRQVGPPNLPDGNGNFGWMAGVLDVAAHETGYSPGDATTEDHVEMIRYCWYNRYIDTRTAEHCLRLVAPDETLRQPDAGDGVPFFRFEEDDYYYDY